MQNPKKIPNKKPQKAWKMGFRIFFEVGLLSFGFVRHEVAQEMRVGPSKSVYRSRLQITSSCIG